MKIIKKISELFHILRVWMKKSTFRTILVELPLGLVIVGIVYLIQDYFYNEELENRENCYAKTIYVGIDQTNYLENIHFKFVTHKGDTILFRTPKIEPWEVDNFDFSKTYTVRYVCDEPKYNELILEDWNGEKYNQEIKPR